MSMKLMNGEIIRVISLIAVILWIALIFSLSAQPAEQSNKLSNGIVRTVIEAIERAIPGLEVDMADLNHLARKYAHFFAYFILGILMVFTLRRMGVRDFKGITISIIICIILAIADEIHQSFVPGRGPQLTDVMIDSIGSIIGIGIYRLLGRLVG